MHVSVFVTCLADQFQPAAVWGMLRVFDRLGISYEVPRAQTCCGQPAFNAGFRHEAQSVARHFIEVFRDAEVIVAPSASCVAMARNHMATLFDEGSEDERQARAIGARTFEFSEFIVDRMRITDVGARFPHKVALHRSCHLLRGLGVRDAPAALLRHVKEIDLVELPAADTCCGFGGVFAVKYPDISGAIGAQKLAAIRSTGAEFVVANDAGCLMHMGGLLHRAGDRTRPMHLAELVGHE